jgi:transposase
MSERAVARHFGIDRKTVSKILKHSVPPGYRRERPPTRPKLDPFIAIIDQILEEDKARIRKQRHTAKRIFERLRDEHGFTGGITIVTDYVREKKRRTREVFVPLAHPPGHAQVDFGEALGEIGGVVRKLHYFAMALPHSDAFFLKAYPAETTEACLTTGMLRPSRSSAASRCRCCMTTRRLRWRGFSGTGPDNAPGPSPSCSRITCSRTGSVGQARAMTRVTSRG